MATATGPDPAPWYAAYPAPERAAAAISRADVLQMLRTEQTDAGRDLVLVDVRRNDFEVMHGPLQSI
jgi:arsenical-resistance protein 2